MFIVTAEQMHRLDQRAIEEFGIPGLILMENAGHGVCDLIYRHFAARLPQGVTVLVGPGNNGGDGLVIARHLYQAGIKVEVLLLVPGENFKGDALTNYKIVKRFGIPITECLDSDSLLGASESIKRSGVIVDAIFGTGLAREVTGRFAQCIEEANKAPAPIVAVDIPSGLSADTGRLMGTAIRADVTGTMALAKIGLVLHPGADYVGKLHVIEIGIPQSAVAEADIKTEFFDEHAFKALLRPRPATGHKGTFGHLLILAGSRGKAGAAALVAHGALRAGAGLVTLGCPSGIQSILAQKLTEAMVEGLPETKTGTLSKKAVPRIESMLEKKKSLAIGPGLGLDTETQTLARQLLETVQMPIVADADALHALGTDHGPVMRAKQPRILTPHPGEMAYLLGCTIAEVQHDRIAAASSLAHSSRAIVVLKGARTVVAAPDGKVSINSTGNPGMGAGGMGDSLTGIIGGLLAQSYAAWDAARISVFAHGRAADQVAKIKGNWGYLASEVADWMPHLF
ncbi:MAG: NAD(P)H-hydrate dehydratase [Nitrospiraceae bacterium]|nr:NAD(P)H-hydrate dehydratase [Nitrospiraceae bacterium]